ncbi:hypothetical protein BOX15_Mlig011325g3, partial [Macrostomum lignano]
AIPNTPLLPSDRMRPPQLGGVAAALAVAFAILAAESDTTTVQPAVYGRSSMRNRSLEKKLIKTLLHRYNETGIVGRPVVKASDLMTIQFGLAIIQILDLDENRQFLRTNCWMRYAWQDPLLNWTWNGTEEAREWKSFENITQLRLNPEDVWTPDIRLFNFADTRLKEKRTARIVVYQDGSVLWVPQSLFKSTCEIEIKYFPFDTQTCSLEFGSRTYDLTKINLTWYPFEYEVYKYEPNPYVDFTNYIRSHEWITDGQEEFTVRPSQRERQLKSRMKCKKITTLDRNGTKHTRIYQTLVYKIRMRRNPAFYLSILVLPCILLSCLTWVIFWLPPESPAKMLLGMNIFVAFFVLMLLLAKTTPSAVRDFPYIGYFYGFNMVLITLSTFLAAIVLNFYVRAERQKPMNHILRRWAVEGLGRMFLVRQAVPLKSPAELSAASSAAEAAALRSASHQTLSGGLAVSAKSATDDAGDSPILSMPSGPGGMAQYGEVEREVREIRQFLKSYVGRLKEKDRRNMASMEWRTLAVVLDRLFFTAYLICFFAAVIVFIPRGHEPLEDYLNFMESDACYIPI